MTRTLTIDNTRALDLIERENETEPSCACGSWTEPVWRDGAVWLECSTLARAQASGRSRLLASLMSIQSATATGAGKTHTRRRLVDIGVMV